MVLEYKFKGLMAPVFTSFTNTLDLDLSIIPEYGATIKRSGIHGVLVNGTTGEGVSMTQEEREAAVETWAREGKCLGLDIMAQVGGAPLRTVQAMAKHAESEKVSAILCLPDLFFRPSSISELVSYLEVVGQAAPSTPLFYYHIPSFTAVHLDMGNFLKEGHSRLPTLAGIKFTHTDLEQGARCVEACNRTYTVFLGADQVTSGGAMLGFDSAISTTLNMYPELSQGILQSVKEGKNEEARALQLRLTNNINRITSQGSWVASMKAAMKIVTGLDFGPPRTPLMPLSESQICKLKNDLME